MKYLRITATASRDLEAISDYFLEISVDAGDRFVQTFNQKCQHLARFPYIGKSYARLRPGLRGLLMMDYIVFYQVLEDNVEILRVVSGYRDLQSVFPNN
ncbi:MULTISPECIES: type II toxin-antitoxin system RelE/ParE family toxin [Nostocaceae]|uniref:Plasmid stabilization protein n=2 Tax=Nostocaceae TaxID=1162 RepID=A0A433UNA6_ANAVA|nr:MULTISPECIES: type II toxin-antitoxin system RelE/ParE family toxin [Nostocaceae]MBD2570420.1 type II toxin-antitoxin system RelE/ParE family toxin [Anabaena lutea FACHB-196]MBD2626818.1 type II toxin-antitoxin system RelE/ParE family toxin [Trichormus variabilis FACHB-164]RUS95320.1 plasmid stabilization protein [Trichormus variabilis SAG 1403-4b]